MTIHIKLTKTSVKCLVEIKSKMGLHDCHLSFALREVKMVLRLIWFDQDNHHEDISLLVQGAPLPSELLLLEVITW